MYAPVEEALARRLLLRLNSGLPDKHLSLREQVWQITGFTSIFFLTAERCGFDAAAQT